MLLWWNYSRWTCLPKGAAVERWQFGACVIARSVIWVIIEPARYTEHNAAHFHSTALNLLQAWKPIKMHRKKQRKGWGNDVRKRNWGWILLHKDVFNLSVYYSILFLWTSAASWRTFSFVPQETDVIIWNIFLTVKMPWLVICFRNGNYLRN